MKKNLISLTLIIFLLCNLIVAASAITGSIGNSRMVLNLFPGESVEKYINVINSNDVPLTVTLSASGELADNVKIKDETFVLQAKSERKAYFTIKADEAGITETKINVKFKPEEGSGVGLSSTVIVIAKDDSGTIPDDETDISEEENSSDDVSIGFGSTDNSEKLPFKMSPAILLSVSTLILVAVFLALIFYLRKSPAKKEVGRRNVKRAN